MWADPLVLGALWARALPGSAGRGRPARTRGPPHTLAGSNGRSGMKLTVNESFHPVPQIWIREAVQNLLREAQVQLILLRHRTQQKCAGGLQMLPQQLALRCGLLGEIGDQSVESL